MVKLKAIPSLVLRTPSPVVRQLIAEYVPNVVITIPFLFPECDLPNKTYYTVCNNTSNTVDATCVAVYV